MEKSDHKHIFSLFTYYNFHKLFMQLFLCFFLLFFSIETLEAKHKITKLSPPNINIIFLDDAAILPQDVKVRHNNWDEWETRLPNFIDMLEYIAPFTIAVGKNENANATLYAIEISSRVRIKNKEEIITKSLQQIYNSTVRPSAILARSTMGDDQLRIIFQDSHDYPPAHAAKFLRIFGEISPIIPHRRIAENFGPFQAPPTIIFDPRANTFCAGQANKQLAKKRWGVLEDTYLLPHYVIHNLAVLNKGIKKRGYTFYVESIPELGTFAGKNYKTNLFVAATGINAPSGEFETDVLRMVINRAGTDSHVVQINIKEWKQRGLSLDNPKMLAELRTFASMNTRHAQAAGKNIIFDIRPDLSPYLIKNNILRLKDIVDYLIKSPHWKAESSLYAKVIDIGLAGFNDASKGGASHLVAYSEAGYAFALTKGQTFNSVDLFKVRVGSVMASTRIGETDISGGKIRLWTGKGDIPSLWNLATKSETWKIANKYSGVTALHDKNWRGHGLPLTTSHFEMYTKDTGLKTDIILNPSKFDVTKRMETGGILFEKGNVYSLDLTGKVRRLGDKAVEALDSSDGISGTFVDEGMTYRVVGIPMGSKKHSKVLLGNILMLQHDTFDKEDDLPFAVPRFLVFNRFKNEVFGKTWTFEPITIRGVSILKQEPMPESIQVNVIPEETGNRLSYLIKEFSMNNDKSVDQIAVAFIAYKEEGSDFWPALMVNTEKNITWIMRHGLKIKFDSFGHIQSIVGPAGERVNYLHDRIKLIGQQASSGKQIKIRYKDNKPVEINTSKSVPVMYGYQAGLLSQVINQELKINFSYKNTGKISLIAKGNNNIHFGYDSKGRVNHFQCNESELTIEYIDDAHTLRLLKKGKDSLDWRFRPNKGLSGIVSKEKGILWTKSSEGRIIQLTVAKLEKTKNGYNVYPELIIGTQPAK